MGVPRRALAPGYTISRVIKGGWQLAGGHGTVDAESALADMDAFLEAGITTWDCADIYTGVEALIGEYLRRVRVRHGASAAARLQVHTKCVPDRASLRRLTRQDVTALVDRSLARLGVERLDLVQVHWWDFETPGWIEAAQWLDDLRGRGKVRHVGLTNFDRARLDEVLRAGVQVASHQVQYSVLDRRPARGMAGRSADLGVGLLCYGALAGGFLSERWLGEPDPAGAGPALENRSLVKYRLIIDEYGGWPAFQCLLRTLEAIARRHGTTIGAVALRWVLDSQGVAAVIVGARHARHIEATCHAAVLALDDNDRAAIAREHAAHPGPSGEVYGLERVPGGPHAVIMRDNLNRAG